MTPSRLDAFAVSAAAVALVAGTLYVAIMHQQADRPLWWVLAALLIGAVAAAVGADRHRSRRHRLTLLLGTALTLGGLGLLAILTIGLVILVAAALSFVAAVRVDLARGPVAPG